MPGIFNIERPHLSEELSYKSIFELLNPCASKIKMAFCIEKFSASLCLAHVTALTLDDLPPACFELTDDADAVLRVIHILRRMFSKELDSVSEKISQEYFCESFMKAFLSRCIIISDKPSYLKFLLLCSLIETVAGPIFSTHECFTYAMICCLCLRSVYERCYKDLFDEIQESESLGSYCRSINIFTVAGESKVPLSVHQRRNIRLLLSHAVDVDHNNFILTESESETLHETLYGTISIMGRKDIFQNPYESMDMWCDCCFFSNDAEDVEEGMYSECSEEEETDSLSSEEEETDSVSSGKEEECSPGGLTLCDLCVLKCYKYLVIYRCEMLQQEVFVDRSNNVLIG
ncbi:hypothetical protein HNY73_008752 [Argiope bruennichi]|uniref:Uncharacterized protein n=1 Tax=Argiope bruennichi TaxID=94029 RepID=A0A8T0F7E5_ARGBR|nr:hypothetical protein HNY73_008752 [Argiope bruennichi]